MAIGQCLLLALILSALPLSGVARTVSDLKIKGAGLSIESEERNTKEGCKQFKPTHAQVRRFFNRAYPVEGYMVTTERYSPCYAEGSLRFSDGSFGQWILYSGGTASFTFNRGDQVFLYYKDNKWKDPAACTYGLSNEGEC